MSLEYYELIAAELCRIPVSSLFDSTRKEEVVLARQFCIALRHIQQKMSFSVSAGKYGLDHATGSHAVKTLDDYIFSKHQKGELYKEFLEKCRIEEEFRNTNAGKIMGEVEKLNLKISEIGFSKFMDEAAAEFDLLFRKIRLDTEEIHIKSQIIACQAKLDEIKLLYD